MELRLLSSSQTELQIGSVELLFSYKTCVAAWDTGVPKGYVLDLNLSKTTARHIATWSGSKQFVEVKRLGETDFWAKVFSLLKECFVA